MLEKFEKAAIAHEEATEAGNHRAANKSYDVIVKVIRILREQGEMLALMSFLNHSSDGVMVWAATYLLSLREEEAVRTLERIAVGGGLRAFAAEIVLREWRKGTLRLG